MSSACAVEFLHTSSLILDELSGTDDPDPRHNRRGVRLVFGEGLAVLAALALVNQAYALFVAAARARSTKHGIEHLLIEVTNCIGANGMIGGQVTDLESSATVMASEEGDEREAKSVALMRLMMTANALAADAVRDDCVALAQFGELFGEGYQICDDVTGKLADSWLTGKTPNQDSVHFGPTVNDNIGRRDSLSRAVARFVKGETLLRVRFGNCLEVELLVEITNSIISVAGDRVPRSEVAVGS